MTPDLRHARVFFSVLGSTAERDDTAVALNRAAGFVRTEFARRAKLRYVPDISFHFDKSVEHGSHISALIEKVRQDDNRPKVAPSVAAEPGGGDDPDDE